MADIITFKDPAEQEKQRQEKAKEAMLDVLDHMRELVEDGKIVELSACSLDNYGDAQIHVYVGDKAAGVGLFEIGKHILMTQYNYED